MLVAPGHTLKNETETLGHVDQTSLVPTVAALFGVPVPLCSTGRLIDRVVDILPPRDRLKALRANARQLAALAGDNVNLDEAEHAHKHYVLTGEGYQFAAEAYSDVLAASQSILTGRASGSIVQRGAAPLLWTTTALMLCTAAAALSAAEKMPKMSPMWGAAAATVVELISVSFDHDDASMQETDALASMPQFSSRGALILSAFIVGQFRPLSAISIRASPSLLFAVPVVLQPLTFFSSSFVEEEHFVWHWIAATGVAVLALTAARDRKSRLVAFACGLGVLLRLMFAWNAHGVKWADPSAVLRGDIERTGAATIASVFATLVLLFMAPKRSFIYAIAAAVAIVAYRLISPPSLVAARVAYVAIAAAAALGRDATWPLAALTLLLARPSQAPLIPMLVAFQRGTFFLFDRLNIPGRTAWTIATANAAFFALGNSNGISTVDLGGAYTGVGAYSPVVVGVLVFLSTWSGPLLVALPRAERGQKTAFIMLAWAAWAAAVYSAVAVVMAEHLFVWSVFSPKYIYMFFWSAVWAIAAVGLQ